jgi:transcriptional regulator with XRE-family HTH domain
MASMAEGHPPLRSMAEKLNHLFETVLPEGGRRRQYSYEEVAAAIAARGGAISPQYIWQLRTGRKDNPTLKHLEALAGFFRVPAAYFLDEKIAGQLSVLKALADADVRAIALRTTGLSPASLDALKVVVDRIRELEGLPPYTEHDGDDTARVHRLSP